MAIKPDVFFTGRGTIQLEYETGDEYLEIEIYPSKFEIYRDTKNISEVEREIARFHENITDFSGQQREGFE